METTLPHQHAYDYADPLPIAAQWKQLSNTERSVWSELAKQENEEELLARKQAQPEKVSNAYSLDSVAMSNEGVNTHAHTGCMQTGAQHVGQSVGLEGTIWWRGFQGGHVHCSRASTSRHALLKLMCAHVYLPPRLPSLTNALTHTHSSSDYGISGTSTKIRVLRLSTHTV